VGIVVPDAGAAMSAAAEGYGWSPEVQRKVLACCLRDPLAWATGGRRVYDAKWISHAPLKPIAEELYKMCAANGRPPSPELLEQQMVERLPYLRPHLATAVRQELALVLATDLADAPLIRARAATWAMTQAVAQAVMQGAALVDSGDLGNGNGEKLVALIQDALAVGRGSSRMLDLIGDRDAVLELLSKDTLRTPTGIAMLDRALNGGAMPGLHVVAGDPKLGKTSFLGQIARGSAICGKVVYWVSAEITERPQALRLLTGMSGLPKDVVRASPARAFRAIQSYYLAGGRILLEYAPGFSADWLAGRVRQLEADGWRIDVIIADYIDLMEHAGTFNDERFKLRAVSKALRDLGAEVGVPVWSAKSVGRQAVDKVVVTKKDLAEAFVVAYVADDIFALCATSAERRKGVVIEVDGRRWTTPIIRLFFAAGREDQDEWMLAGYQRDNDRQRWSEIPGYLEWFAAQQRGAAESQGG